jgi:hypothetical protein
MDLPMLEILSLNTNWYETLFGVSCSLKQPIVKQNQRNGAMEYVAEQHDSIACLPSKKKGKST